MPNGNTKKVDGIKTVKDVKIIQTMQEMQDRKGGGILIMYKEKEKYDLQKMTTRSTEMCFCFSLVVSLCCLPYIFLL